MKILRCEMARQELVDFLLTVDKQHIIDLVDIITDFGKGRSTLNSTVKDVLILAKESNRNFTKDEINLLLIEFQKYGGDTFANAIRSKDNLITYHEILNDVFELLIGDKNQLTNEEKEQKIIQTLFSTEWESIPFEDRYKKSIDMGKIISKNITDGIKNNSLINITSKVLTKVNPLGIIGSFALGLSSPALRITIPFVVQIAWLKMMKQNYWDKHEIESVKILSNQNLIIADAADEDVILSLTEYTEPPKIKNEFNESNISIFNQLFSNIPSLATKFETVKNQIVSIPPRPRRRSGRCRSGPSFPSRGRRCRGPRHTRPPCVPRGAGDPPAPPAGRRRALWSAGNAPRGTPRPSGRPGGSALRDRKSVV